MEARPEGNCSNPECSFGGGGKCIEGFEDNEVVSKCPHFGLQEVGHDVEASPHGEKLPTERAKVAATADSDVALSSGRGLRLADAYSVCSTTPAKIILCAGPNDSGKSTFVVSLYEKWRRGEFARHLFSGSSTLLGFEERCHLSRSAAETSAPDTERTLLHADDILLHLSLASSADTSKKVDLLLVDVSGELFEAARHRATDVHRIPFIDMADFFVLFFDGEHLLDPNKKHYAKQRGIDVLHSCYEQGVIGGTSNIQIVSSKEDIVQKDENSTSAQEFRDNIFSQIETDYEGIFNSLNFHIISARPGPGSTLDAAYGIESAVSEWIRIEGAPAIGRDYESALSQNARKIDAFLQSM